MQDKDGFEAPKNPVTLEAVTLESNEAERYVDECLQASQIYGGSWQTLTYGQLPQCNSNSEKGFRPAPWCVGSSS